LIHYCTRATKTPEEP